MSAHSAAAIVGTALALALTTPGAHTPAASAVAPGARPAHVPCLGCDGGRSAGRIREWRRAELWRWGRVHDAQRGRESVGVAER
jgi:hypothetical protein